MADQELKPNSRSLKPAPAELSAAKIKELIGVTRVSYTITQRIEQEEKHYAARDQLDRDIENSLRCYTDANFPLMIQRGHMPAEMLTEVILKWRALGWMVDVSANPSVVVIDMPSSTQTQSPELPLEDEHRMDNDPAFHVKIKKIRELIAARNLHMSIKFVEEELTPMERRYFEVLAKRRQEQKGSKSK